MGNQLSVAERYPPQQQVGRGRRSHSNLLRHDYSSSTDDSNPNPPEFRLAWGSLFEKGKVDVTETAGGAKITTLKVFNFHDLRNHRLIGEGGFGKVLEGFLQGSHVAVKMFNVPLVMMEARGEIGPLVRLQHRNLVIIKGIMTSSQFLDVDVVAIGSPKILLDYFPEGSLLKYLSNPKNPQDYAMLGKLTLDIIRGCEYLHGKGIIHGNLAARNIMVEKGLSKRKAHYNAKVGDYGISRLVRGSGGNYMTLGNGKIVPIRWVPKELVMEDATETDFTKASDVWSFGVVLWEMWTKGAVPYGVSYTNMEVLEFLKSGKSPLRDIPKGCPKYIIAEMEKVFRVDPAERPSFSKLEENFETLKQISKEMARAKIGESNQQNKGPSGSVTNGSNVSNGSSGSKSTNQNQAGIRKKGPPATEVVAPARNFVKPANKAPHWKPKPKNPGNYNYGKPVDQQQFKKPNKDNSQLKPLSTHEQNQVGGQNQAQNCPSKNTNGKRGGKPRRYHNDHGRFPPGPENQKKNSDKTPVPEPPPPYTPGPFLRNPLYPGLGLAQHNMKAPGQNMRDGIPPPEFSTRGHPQQRGQHGSCHSSTTECCCCGRTKSNYNGRGRNYRKV